MILGLGAILIATTTTAVSLVLYHNSGDIYLDRSRPGFLPDKKEKPVTITEYLFPDGGWPNKIEREKYLREYEKNLNQLKTLADPFSEKSLSDEILDLAE